MSCENCGDHGVVMERLEQHREANRVLHEEAAKSREAMWKMIHTKTSQRLFLSLFGIMVVIIVGFMGYTSSTVHAVEKTVIRMESQQEVILQKLNVLEQK